jgi:hypothetical protein
MAVRLPFVPTDRAEQLRSPISTLSGCCIAGRGEAEDAAAQCRHPGELFIHSRQGSGESMPLFVDSMTITCSDFFSIAVSRMAWPPF